MFTGIVDHCGIVKSVEKTDDSSVIWIQSQFEGFDAGESVCTDGVCLTVTEFREGLFRVDVSPETLARSRFSEVRVGDALNLERSLRMGDRLGGHYVTGHVDETAVVKQRNTAGEYVEFWFSDISKSCQNLLVKKGSVTVNGVSLTINDVKDGEFSVMLIPHTLERTNLSELTSNCRVNIEFDWMIKVISQQVKERLEQLNA